ncbi:MAG: hypothetical protein PVI87_10240 [Gammaproteobacteria bacterium]|jgi:hypothetical protein
MNKGDGGIVRTQAEALKELLEQSRENQCRELKEHAALEAREIRRRARRRGRERVSRAAHEERARLEREVRLVEAEIETEQRRRERLRDLALIEAGHEALRETLAGRWRARDQRLQWAAATLQEAREVLFGREWVLEHPPDWAGEEVDAAILFAREQCGAEVTASPADGLEAGLRIRCKGALVDMSVAGLMAHGRALEGALLAAIDRVEADAAEGEAS